MADRWVITQFATATGGTPITDECVAVSTSGDATGTYNRYGFHLGSNFFDYPHLSIWPDAYYMSINVFNAADTAYLGPQPFALDRTAMLAGAPATFISPVGPLGGSVAPFLPADLNGFTLPPAGAPNTFVKFPDTGNYTIYHFHVDFATPANSTFTTFATPAAAGFTALCPTTRSCVPELGVSSGNKLDGIGATGSCFASPIATLATTNRWLVTSLSTRAALPAFAGLSSATLLRVRLPSSRK